jgi:aspartate-semialdehyde dehydrogenase
MLKKKSKYIVAITGATGTVGREMVEILEERKFPVEELVLLASEQSEGERVEFHGKKVAVRKIARDSFKNVDISLFSANKDSSLEFAASAVASGSIVVDNSSAYRMDPKVPLVVPEVNAYAIEKHAGILASPNDSTISMVMALKPIHDKFKIKRIVATIFQSVSGTGKKAIDELAQQTVALLNFRDVETKVYPHQIAFNCVPHVGSFLDNGYTRVETELVEEARKIMEDESIRISATAVLVPVFRGNSQSVNIETQTRVSADEMRAILAASPGIMVYDDPKKNLYPLAVDTAGKDEIYVGRIREDVSVPNGINLWIVSDNIRKGAALNAVQIAEHLIKEHHGAGNRL